MNRSISFDHAADTYDATRALPADVAEKQTDAIVAQLASAGADRLLEVGIGTGRIARPLAERAVNVCGVDIAPRMLAKLREQIGPKHLPPDLVLGDATRLPFASGSIPALLVVHVLHLVSDWRQALEELRRVLAPGGVYLHDFTRYPGDNPWLAGLEKREELLGSLGVVLRRRPSPDEISDALRSLGGSLRTVVYAEDEERSAPGGWLERARERIDSWTWEVPEEIFPRWFALYEEWYRQHYNDLDREYVQPVSYELEVWSFG